MGVLLMVGAMVGKGAAAESFPAVLHSAGPAQDRAEKMMLYGQFVGDWEGDVVDYLPDGSHRNLKAEVHFGWVLEGRAVQDVWILPPRAERRPDELAPPNLYGTTVRVYDPKTDAWRITWINPVSGDESRLVGRKVGDTIVQEGTKEDGTRMRWSFRDLKADSFRWTGEKSADGGKTWVLNDEVFLRRVR